MKEALIRLLELLGLAYWVEIATETPRCVYYFGPFLNQKEAKAAQGGYVEDLEQEGTQGITITIKRCKPENLTIFDEVEEPNSERFPALSGQPS